jgi:hypothetical protein
MAGVAALVALPPIGPLKMTAAPATDSAPPASRLASP